MLNLFNNNLSLFDNNLLSYSLLLGSLGILGYSMFYFSGYLTNADINQNIHTLPNTETFTQRLVENLENHSVANIDNVVPIMSNKLETITQGINTDGTNLVDSSVLTDQKMLYDYMNELLYNNATPMTSLGEISPTYFIREYRNDPALASYFDKTADWADSISRQTSGTSANSEIIFMRKIGEEINNIRDLISNNLSSVNVNSNPISPVVEHPVSKILEQNSLLSPSYDGWLNEIFNKIINLQDKITDIEQLRKLIDLYSIIPNEIYNVDYVSTLIIYGSI